MKKRAAICLSMVLALVLGIAGCASETKLNASETIATLDDKAIPLGEVNFMLRYQQAQMETYYGSMLGTNIYQQDLSGSGTLYGDMAKDELLKDFERMYILEAEAENYGISLTEEEKKAISDAAAEFLSENDEKVKEVITADQATVERVLTLYTLNDKVRAAMVADVDKEVSDEEAAQKKISYLYMSAMGTEQDADGNTMELTEEERAEKKASLQEILDQAKESNDLEAAAKAADMTATTMEYGDENTTLAEVVRTAADSLSDGEFSEILEVENGYYVVQMISTFDREATDTRKDAIVTERENALFEEKYAKLQETHTFTPAEDVLAKLTFERTFSLKIGE